MTENRKKLVELKNVSLTFNEGKKNEVKAIMWVKMSDLDNYQWAFNHRHLIEGIFYTYVDYEEVEGLNDLFAE